MVGEVIGHAGASLGAGLFGEKGKVGQRGERRSEELLARVAANGATIAHDLRIPIPGFKANIDHAIISGRTVTLIDTKVWRSGIYWTLGGKTRRGLTSAEYCDKKTLPTGVDAISRHFDRMGVKDVTFRQSVLLVWTPGGDTEPNFLFYRPQGARVISAGATPGAATARRIARHAGTNPAHPQVVDAISTILYRT